MDALWLLVLVPLLALTLVARQRLNRPTVAEVHSWREGQHYRMLLVLNGSDLILLAGLRLPDLSGATVQEAAKAMMHVLARKVRFTPRTVYIPEGPMGLNAAPAA